MNFASIVSRHRLGEEQREAETREKEREETRVKLLPLYKRTPASISCHHRRLRSKVLKASPW